MASASSVKALLLVVVAAMFAATSAQEFGASPAPAPAPDAGAAFSLPAATALVGASVLLSISALFRH